MSLPKIHPRYTIVTTAGIMAFIMSAIISLSLTLINSHFALQALLAWPAQWARSFVIGWPVAAGVLPLVRRMVTRLIAV